MKPVTIRIVTLFYDQERLFERQEMDNVIPLKFRGLFLACLLLVHYLCCLLYILNEENNSSYLSYVSTLYKFSLDDFKEDT